MEETSFQLQQVNQVVSVEKTERTAVLAQALAASGVCDATLVLTCEQLHTFEVRSKWISSGEGGIYFSLILHNDRSASHAFNSMMHALVDCLRAGLPVRVNRVGNAIKVWDKTFRVWKQIATVSIQPLSSAGIVLSVELLLNNKPPRCVSGQYISVKQLVGCEVSKELFLEDLLESFWKYQAWK